MEIQFKSDIDVEYVGHMGDDLMVVKAMMVSTKGMLAAEDAESKAMEGRLNYLMSRRHGTPFEHGSLTVRVHAPIKVWREWHRHRVGWSYNEESGRYKQLSPLFYVPPPERPLIEAPDFKAARPEFVPAGPLEYHDIMTRLKLGYTHAYAVYENLLQFKVDKGVARDVLGVGIYSACYCTANPRSIMHFLELRTKRPEGEAKRPSSPLWEINAAATELEAIFAQHWPLTYHLWNKHGRMAP